MKSVISYTLSHCQKCLKCLKVCPTEAITIVQERVHIDSRRCINCGHCIEVCNTQGLQGKGSTLVDLDNYDYTVALLPSALFSCTKNAKEAAQLVEAIRRLGFDEVVEMSAIEGAIQHRVKQRIKDAVMHPLISSFCPVVNRLIRLRYPMLLDRLLDLDYPNEIAADLIRTQRTGKGKVGIFCFCECVSKLQLARYPYGNRHSQIDHAVSIGDHFPLIRALKDNEASSIELCRSGLESASLHHDALKGLKVLEADGQDKVQQVLELAEFGQLDQFDYLSLSFCINGCIGGRLLWGNPFEAELHLKKLLETAKKPAVDEDLIPFGSHQEESVSDLLTIQEKLKLFEKVNEVMEKLPHFDCGACGFASCRNMAENIATGKRKLTDCRVLRNDEVKK